MVSLEEERLAYWNQSDPEKYPKERICRFCPGKKFKDLEEHAAHLASHSPAPAQWMEASKKIEATKPKKEKPGR